MDTEQIERFRTEMEREAEHGGPPEGFPTLDSVIERES
jgi:hypothetical protein